MPEPFGYKSDGETVTLTMTRDDYMRLLLHLGFAAGAIECEGDRPERDTPGGRLCESLAFVNRLNAGNPNWTPYEIPDEETGSRP